MSFLDSLKTFYLGKWFGKRAVCDANSVYLLLRANVDIVVWIRHVLIGVQLVRLTMLNYSTICIDLQWQLSIKLFLFNIYFFKFHL